MKFAYYPGCVLNGTAKEYNISMRTVFKALGAELVEIPNWVCCGATSAHATNENLALTLPYMTLVQTEEMKMDTLTAPCSACFNRFKIADYQVKNDEEKYKTAKRITGRSYKKKVKVTHPLQNVIEDIGLENLQKMIKKKLDNLKIASYYGCLLLRPKEMTDFDDTENPKMMEKLVSALGATPVEFAFKQECCGASYSASKKEMACELSRRIISSAKENGADLIMVGCPLCHVNLDLRQSDIEKLSGEKLNVPILYFTQLIGLALGLDVRQLSLDTHFVDTLELLKRKELIE